MTAKMNSLYNKHFELPIILAGLIFIGCAPVVGSFLGYGYDRIESIPLDIGSKISFDFTPKAAGKIHRLTVAIGDSANNEMLDTTVFWELSRLRNRRGNSFCGLVSVVVKWDSLNKKMSTETSLSKDVGTPDLKFGIPIGSIELPKSATSSVSVKVSVNQSDSELQNIFKNAHVNFYTGHGK